MFLPHPSLFVVHYSRYFLAILTDILFLTNFRFNMFNVNCFYKKTNLFVLRRGDNLNQRRTRIVPYFLLLDIFIYCFIPTNQGSLGSWLSITNHDLISSSFSLGHNQFLTVNPKVEEKSLAFSHFLDDISPE